MERSGNFQVYRPSFKKTLHTPNTGPLETIFKGLAFGTYGEISSSNVRKLVSMAAEYGHEHLAKTIMAKNLDAAKATIRRRFHARIALASWRGYATMLLGRVQYVGGKSRTFNKVQRQVRLVEQVDMGTLSRFLVMCSPSRPPLACHLP